MAVVIPYVDRGRFTHYIINKKAELTPGFHCSEYGYPLPTTLGYSHPAMVIQIYYIFGFKV